MVHSVGDVEQLTQHITLLHENRTLLSELRQAGISNIPEISWSAAGRSILGAYRAILKDCHSGKTRVF